MIPATLQGFWPSGRGSLHHVIGGDVPRDDLIAFDNDGRHGARCHADFFSSPSTSSNSASTTSESAEPSALAPAEPSSPPPWPCWAAYIASPSFMEAWISVWV